MRCGLARLVVLGLILAFPVLIVASSPASASWSGSTLPVFAVELMLIGGLVFAARERRRLLTGQEALAPRPISRPRWTPAPHALPERRRATIGAVGR
jgi:hypothetical protein